MEPMMEPTTREQGGPVGMSAPKSQPLKPLQSAISSLRTAITQEPEQKDVKQLEGALKILEAVNETNVRESKEGK